MAGSLNITAATVDPALLDLPWNLPLDEWSMGATKRNWPLARGFDRFYGFLGGETNQWAPLVYDGTTVVEVPKDPKYNFMTDMTDHAAEFVHVGVNHDAGAGGPLLRDNRAHAVVAKRFRREGLHLVVGAQ